MCTVVLYIRTCTISCFYLIRGGGRRREKERERNRERERGKEGKRGEREGEREEEETLPFVLFPLSKLKLE